MPKLNENKVRLLTEHLEQAEEGTVTTKDICKVIGSNPRFKAWKGYLAEVVSQSPSLEPKLAPSEPSTEVPAEPEGDDEDLLGGGPQEAPKVEPPTAPSVPAPDHQGDWEKGVYFKGDVSFQLLNKKGMLEPLQIKKVVGENKIILTHKTDEIVKVEIQGQEIKVNLTQLESEGQEMMAKFYRDLANG